MLESGDPRHANDVIYILPAEPDGLMDIYYVPTMERFILPILKSKLDAVEFARGVPTLLFAIYSRSGY